MQFVFERSMDLLFAALVVAVVFETATQRAYCASVSRATRGEFASDDDDQGSSALVVAERVRRSLQQGQAPAPGDDAAGAPPALTPTGTPTGIAAWVDGVGGGSVTVIHSMAGFSCSEAGWSQCDHHSMGASV